MTKNQITKINLNLLKFTRKTWIKIFIVCFFLLLGNTAVAPNLNTDWELVKAKMYESATQQLVTQVDLYIKKYAEDSKLSAEKLVEVCDEYDLDLKLVLAQGHLESHFGTKGMAAITNSVFNVGTFDDGTVMYTYSNPNQSIEPYAQLLTTRYITDEKSEVDLLQNNQFTDIKGKRYASNVNYEEMLSEIVVLIMVSTEIDSLLNVRELFKPPPPQMDIQYLTQK